jgi:hypothetical protein
LPQIKNWYYSEGISKEEIFILDMANQNYI